MSSVPNFAVRILADDLSGAADCAASFTGAVGPLALLLHGNARGEVQVALDADTRALDAAAAAQRWHELGKASAADRRPLLFKKIDSTLRGHIAEELCALLEELPAVKTVVVAPAFPAQGRTYVNGRLRVHGEATEASVGGIGEAIRAAGLPHALLFADATEQADLDALVASMGRQDPAILWVGSAGLARALAGAPPSTVDAGTLQGPTLIVAGSRSAVTQGQVDAFAREHAASVIAFSPGDDTAGVASRAKSAMWSTGVALVHVACPQSPVAASRAVVAKLASALRDVARRSETLLLTGGDTARAMLEALGVGELFIEGEVESGIAVSAPVEPYAFRAVLKAGGFGDNDTFVRLSAAHSPSP